MQAAVGRSFQNISANCQDLRISSLAKFVPINCGFVANAMTTDVRQLKQQTRKHIKQGLQSLTAEQMAHESARITAHVLGLRPYVGSKMIGIYLHCKKLREVDTTQILEDAMRQGKKCYVPVVEDSKSNMKFLHLDELSCLRRVPPFNIQEPPDTYVDGSPRQDVLQCRTCLDVLLVPGLGFDRAGRRLGRGGGYYDKMISQLQHLAIEEGRQPPLIVALSYEAQLVSAVPMDKHDQPVDLVVTASDVVQCTKRGADAVMEMR
ncbi:hypothetical protein VaNZ11_014923 [Volvox africanus]|uniref:5-formyltetrahydrofolate cyclo-ligase n=1 Tax=Volvox africanus TaxID=51714 RepID=A0ABQ5SL58_9CHLO|nr:hypothetical protein VaNZ11_014923 [Volvox africanus]